MTIEKRTSPFRHLPHVLIATFAVVLLPLLIVTAAEAVTGVYSPFLSVGAAVMLSFGVATCGSAYWARRPASRDLLFRDLMLWGWLRRLHTERRLAKATELLGVGHGGTGVAASDLVSERQVELLEQLAASLEARDPHTHGHTVRVTRHCEMIAKEMGLSDEQVAKVRTAASVHDVGKVDLPREIINKPDKLTDEEFEIIKRHPVEGAEMVASLGDAEITAIVRHHHERIDGRGYPDRLSGEEVPLGARIVAVADTFDAITSSRPYRRALSHKKAIEVLKSEAGTQLDPVAVAAFRRYYSGRKSLSWWMLLIAAPHRLAVGLREALQASAALPLANNAAAVAVTAVLGSSLAAPVSDALKIERSARSAGAAEASARPGMDGSSSLSYATGGTTEGNRHESGAAHGGKGLDGSDQATPVAGKPKQGSGQGPAANPNPGGDKPSSDGTETETGTGDDQPSDPEQPGSDEDGESNETAPAEDGSGSSDKKEKDKSDSGTADGGTGGQGSGSGGGSNSGTSDGHGSSGGETKAKGAKQD